MKEAHEEESWRPRTGFCNRRWSPTAEVPRSQHDRLQVLFYAIEASAIKGIAQRFDRRGMEEDSAGLLSIRFKSNKFDLKLT